MTLQLEPTVELRGVCSSAIDYVSGWIRAADMKAGLAVRAGRNGWVMINRGVVNRTTPS